LEEEVLEHEDAVIAPGAVLDEFIEVGDYGCV
jgi:acyl-[acyl carrier protein]--UDP-N-acetylglucosamine O-acyltransferase